TVNDPGALYRWPARRDGTRQALRQACSVDARRGPQSRSAARDGQSLVVRPGQAARRAQELDQARHQARGRAMKKARGGRASRNMPGWMPIAFASAIAMVSGIVPLFARAMFCWRYPPSRSPSSRSLIAGLPSAAFASAMYCAHDFTFGPLRVKALPVYSNFG